MLSSGLLTLDLVRTLGRRHRSSGPLSGKQLPPASFVFPSPASSSSSSPCFVASPSPSRALSLPSTLGQVAGKKLEKRPGLALPCGRVCQRERCQGEEQGPRELQDRSHRRLKMSIDVLKAARDLSSVCRDEYFHLLTVGSSGKQKQCIVAKTILNNETFFHDNFCRIFDM